MIFTLLFCSSAESPSPAAKASRRRRQRSGHRPGHHDHVPATEATSNDSTSSKVHRRECYLASVQMKLLIFTLLFCSSAECFSFAAAASRRRRQRSGHLPGHRGQVHATHSERRRGQRPRHHDQVPATHKERRRGNRPGSSLVYTPRKQRGIARIDFGVGFGVMCPPEHVWLG